MIIISTTHLSEMHAEGVTEYPHECCGGLLGELDPKTGDKILKKVVPIANQWEDTDSEDKRRRFAVTSDDYKRLETEASTLGISLLGFYHSHPDHPPKPSETDLKFAWPVFSYIIFSVEKSEPKELYSYTLKLDGAGFEEEAIKVQ